ncbi:MAG: hypothetical protein HQL23_00880 [Candidatus Omnitrophica bacterium]|nr:hypothetical protein [Candidatus Omnitrophota bacterium]
MNGVKGFSGGVVLLSALLILGFSPLGYAQTAPAEPMVGTDLNAAQPAVKEEGKKETGKHAKKGRKGKKVRHHKAAKKPAAEQPAPAEKPVQ